jgi:tetratricopeptide (TPR) repeat protein
VLPPRPETPAATTPAWLARARTLLSQSSSLRPGFAAPYVLLGSTHTRPDGDAAAGIAALVRARALLPARTDIAGNLVYLYLRAGDAARARAMVDRVLAPSGDEETTKKARLALATYDANLVAQKSIQYSREAEARAARDPHHVPSNDPRIAQFIQTLRELYPTITDPVRKAEILQQIEAYEHPPDIDDLKAREIYNEAIEHANKRDYTKAIALLEELLTHDLGPDFAAQTMDTLEQLRKDQAKHPGPLPQ